MKLKNNRVSLENNITPNIHNANCQNTAAGKICHDAFFPSSRDLSMSRNSEHSLGKNIDFLYLFSLDPPIIPVTHSLSSF